MPPTPALRAGWLNGRWQTHKATRCLKRRLADVVYRTMIRDTESSVADALMQRGAVSETVLLLTLVGHD